MNDKVPKSDGFIFRFMEEILYISFVVLGIYLAFLFRFEMRPAEYNIRPFFDSIPYIIVVSIIIFYIYDIVSTAKKSIFENVLIIFISLILIDIVTVAIVFFNRGFAFPRSVFLLGFLIQFLLIFIAKIMILKVIKTKINNKNIIIIAPKEEAEFIAKKILLNKYKFDRIKYISEEINENTYGLIKHMDKVYVGSTLCNEDKLKIIRYCSGNNKIVYLIPSLFEISLVNFKISQVSDLLVFKLDDLGLTYEQRFFKRLMDIFISMIGLIVTFPIFIIVALVTKLYDKGPILFKQERVTENNEIFKLYKFRTMIIDAEKHSGPVLATEKDPRITPLGKILRTSRIDELPQLINVLKGDMSIVGPRPERPFFVEKFNTEFDEFKYRVYVKAGITGLAQILGNYTTDPKTKAQYDILYIKNYSIFLDIKIIFNTIKIMFLKASSEGTKKEKDLDELLDDLGLNIYKELGITKIE